MDPGGQPPHDRHWHQGGGVKYIVNPVATTSFFRKYRFDINDIVARIFVGVHLAQSCLSHGNMLIKNSEETARFEEYVLNAILGRFHIGLFRYLSEVGRNNPLLSRIIFWYSWLIYLINRPVLECFYQHTC